jgi:hypothetical protein
MVVVSYKGAAPSDVTCLSSYQAEWLFRTLSWTADGRSPEAKSDLARASYFLKNQDVLKVDIYLFIQEATKDPVNSLI